MMQPQRVLMEAFFSVGEAVCVHKQVITCPAESSRLCRDLASASGMSGAAH